MHTPLEHFTTRSGSTDATVTFAPALLEGMISAIIYSLCFASYRNVSITVIASSSSVPLATGTRTYLFAIVCTGTKTISDCDATGNRRSVHEIARVKTRVRTNLSFGIGLGLRLG